MLLAVASSAVAQSAGALAHAVDDHYNHLHSLEAHFTERYQGPGVDRSESGTLLLLKPGRMRWTYDSPAGKLFVVNGGDAISYTPGDPTATRIPARQLADFRSPLALLLGQTHLERELTGLSATLATTGSTTLTGTPRGPLAKQLRQVEVTFTNALHQITTLRLLNTDGTQLTFTFSNQKENLPVTPANFTFTTPPGVHVVEAPAVQ